MFVTSDCQLAVLCSIKPIYLLLLCLEVDSLIVTLQRGTIRGYEMAGLYAEAMLPISTTGLINFCNFTDVGREL